jgi:hypothetical protein
MMVGSQAELVQAYSKHASGGKKLKLNISKDEALDGCDGKDRSSVFSFGAC